MELGITSGGGGEIIREFTAGTNLSKGDLIIMNDNKAFNYKSIENTGTEITSYTYEYNLTAHLISSIENESYIILFLAIGNWGSAQKYIVGTKNADGSITWGTLTSAGFTGGYQYSNVVGMFIDDYGTDSGVLCIGSNYGSSSSFIKPIIYNFSINAGILTFTNLSVPDTEQVNNAPYTNLTINKNGILSFIRYIENGTSSGYTSCVEYAEIKTWQLTNSSCILKKQTKKRLISYEENQSFNGQLKYIIKKTIGNKAIIYEEIRQYSNGYEIPHINKIFSLDYDENYNPILISTKYNKETAGERTISMISSDKEYNYNYDYVSLGYLRLEYDQFKVIGISIADATAGSNVKVKMISPYQSFDIYNNLSVGENYYINTSGGITTENTSMKLGIAISNKELYITPDCYLFNN